MRRVSLFLTTLFLVNLLIIPANSAVKYGNKCAKAGQTSIASGKKFTCIKSGKKLIWNKGVTLPKPAATPTLSISPTPTPTSALTPTPTPIPSLTPVPEVTYTASNYPFRYPCEKDPFVPPQWAEYQEFAIKTLGCAMPLRFLDVSLPNSSPATSLTPNSERNPVAICKIPDVFVRTTQGTNNNVGHRTSWKFAGDLTIPVIPVQFTDFGTNKTPREDYDKYLEYFKEMFYKISDGNTRITFKVPDEYIQLGVSLKSFDTGQQISSGPWSWRKLDIKRLEQIVYSKADQTTNFTGIKMTLLLFPLSVPDDYIAHHPTFRMDRVQTNEGVVDSTYIMPPANMNSRADFYGVEPFLHLHEFFHANGMLSDHLGDAGIGGSFYGMGNWGNMSGVRLDHLTWDKWLSGMLADSQVICAKSTGSATYWVKPATYFGQFEKLLVIPLSSTKVIAVESQRRGGMNFKLSKDSFGALVYSLDVMDTRYDGGFDVIRPKSRTTTVKDGPFIYYDAPLKLNESVEIWGYRISVVEAGDFGDVVKVEKL